MIILRRVILVLLVYFNVIILLVFPILVLWVLVIMKCMSLFIYFAYVLFLCYRILSQENRILAESIQQEAKQKKRLSQHNEELQWKLKQNSEVVSALAALSGVSDISGRC